MWGVDQGVLLLVAAIVGAGLGWLVASRRHPGYVLAFSILVLGIAGLVVAGLPSLLFESGMRAEDPMAVLSDHVQMNRVAGIVVAASIAFAFVAGVRALWSAPARDAKATVRPSSPATAPTADGTN